LPFVLGPPAFTYFFDCGIVARALLAVWRATRDEEFLDTARAIGRAMLSDFGATDGGFHPILSLPGKLPVERDGAWWSRSPGCYQLKSAMAWWDLWEAAAEPEFRAAYERALESALDGHADFLPGHPDREKVMDRLHAYLYFLEGLLPCAADPRPRAALAQGILRVECFVREIAPVFERADVVAQLLRIRLHAACAGAVPLDAEAAGREAATLAGFQIQGGGARTDGGFYFGRRGGAWVPHVSPVSTAFALDALALWNQGRPAPADRRLLI
jgi:hypothetical protein